MNIVIVGGGTAGWFCASHLVKNVKDINITLIESPSHPIIGVGESVTPHVAIFLRNLGFDEHDWMRQTGSIYKYANKFVDWKEGKGESEYFSFNYSTSIDLLLKEVHYITSGKQFLNPKPGTTTLDGLMKLLTEDNFNKFDQYFNGQFHYMEQNVSPFTDDNEYILNPLFSWSQHLNADMASVYCRDKVAKPNGVKHIRQKINKVNVSEGNISNLILEDDSVIDADLFIDCSGFHRVLIKHLDWEVKKYKQHPINSAWVCQLDYSDPETEMVNYTQSIAKDYGWLFKIGLYHRMGSGYCFGTDFINVDKARDEYCDMVNNQKAEPRLLQWSPERLETPAKGNTVSLGLSSGFVEPMEANALFVITTGINHLTDAIKNRSSTVLDFTKFNKTLGCCIDDIADFIMVHYTLSSRDTNEFWKEMKELGRKENHIDMLYEKYRSSNNTMAAAFDGLTLFPDYMWAQLAHSWGVDLSKWKDIKVSDLELELSKLHYTHYEQKHRTISKTRMNNHQWLKQNVYENLTPNEWEATYLRK